MIHTPNTWIIICGELPILWWALAHLKVYKQNVSHTEYSVSPSRFPFIIIYQFFPQEADLHASPSSHVFSLWLGSTAWRTTIQSEDRSWVRLQYLFLLPSPHTLFLSLPAGLQQKGAPFLYPTPWLLLSGSSPIASYVFQWLLQIQSIPHCC